MAYDQSQKKQGKAKRNYSAGFSLVEMIVAMAIFVIILTVVIGALISLQNASREARAVRIVTDNLGAALDSMSRNIRTGTYLHCGCPGAAPYVAPQSCPMTDITTGAGGGTCIAFESQGGDPSLSTDQYVYQLTGDRIMRSTQGGAAGSFLPLTAPELHISSLRFYVGGTSLNTDQPYAIIMIKGTASTSRSSVINFNLQTTTAQRTPNFNLSAP